MKNQTEDYVFSTRKIRIAENIYVRIIRENGERAEVAIIVNEFTTSEQYREAWQPISRLRDQLHLQQGTDLRKASQLPKLLLFHLWARHNRLGASYQELAMEVNFDCLVNLCRAFIAFERYAVSHDDGARDGFRESMFAAQALLRAVRLKDKDVAQWTYDGLFQIQNGNAPWSLLIGPVDAQRVRDSLRQLENEVGKGKLVIKNTQQSMPEGKMMNLSELATPVNEEPVALAERLLAKMEDTGGLDQLLAAIQRQLKKGAMDNSGQDFP